MREYIPPETDSSQKVPRSQVSEPNDEEIFIKILAVN